jgi:DNA repair protein RadC
MRSAGAGVAGRTAGTPGDGTEAEVPHHVGHRARLRARFVEAGEQALQDYELLELLLFQLIPRKDVKPLAKSLLREFGGLWTVVNAPPGELVRRGGLTEAAAAGLAVVSAVSRRMHWRELQEKPVLGSWTRLIEYCERAMAHEATEQVRVLHLDRKNALIADEVVWRGTVDQAPVYPREVVKRALALGASALILVHNHPSGDPEPSRADIEMTKELARAASALGIALHDHVVVGKGRHVSFKAKGLI